MSEVHDKSVLSDCARAFEMYDKRVRDIPWRASESTRVSEVRHNDRK